MSVAICSTVGIEHTNDKAAGLNAWENDLKVIAHPTIDVDYFDVLTLCSDNAITFVPRAIRKDSEAATVKLNRINPSAESIRGPPDIQSQES